MDNPDVLRTAPWNLTGFLDVMEKSNTRDTWQEFPIDDNHATCPCNVYVSVRDFMSLGAHFMHSEDFLKI